jgi:hypothetical protein
MKIRLDKNGKVINNCNYTSLVDEMKFVLQQLNAEINRRYGKATQEELDFLAQNPKIDTSFLDRDTDAKS